MRKLVIPNISPKEVYATTKEKSGTNFKKQRLEALENYVLERYEDYDEKCNELERISDSNISDTGDKEALLSCYTRNKQGYLEGEVVTKIISSQSIQHRHNCPYCGMDTPRTIDHYLPKADFPEFSIYPPNLIPCCGYCNQKKSKVWRQNGKRTFINLYFDEIPEREQYLFLNIEYKNNEKAPYIIFEIHNRDNIESDLFELIKGHYTTLNLLNEFAGKINNLLSDIVDRIVHNPTVPKEEHQDNFKKLYESYTRNYGLNHWETILYQNLQTNNDFIVESIKRAS